MAASAGFRIAWPDFTRQNADLRLIVHPRRADLLVYDIRPRRPERELPNWTKAFFTPPAQGFSFRIIPTDHGDTWCVRAVLSKGARERLRAVMDHEQINLSPLDIDSIFMVTDDGVRDRYKEKWRTYALPNDGIPDRSDTVYAADGSTSESERAGLDQAGDLPQASEPLSDRRGSKAGGESLDARRRDGRGGPPAPVAESSAPPDASDDPPSPGAEAEVGGLFEDLFVPDSEALTWKSFQHAARADVNTQIIKTLEQIRLERRVATLEEKRLLSLYAGWGALPAVAEGSRHNYANKWADEARDSLRQALATRAAHQDGFSADEAFQSLKSSILNAHYTAPAVVDAIWALVERTGFAGGRVLEPSAGAGIFIGRMPLALRRRSQITAVEIEPIAADVLRTLYPEVQVIERPFQDTSLPNGYFDLVISNVPFANVPVYDALRATSSASLHDYFLERAVNSLRPGGLCIALTSAYSLDKTSTGVRQRLGQKARLIGALRLPKESQAAQAGTEVVEDLLFFQALAPGQTPDTSFLESRHAALSEDGVTMVARADDSGLPVFDAHGRETRDAKNVDWEATRTQRFRVNAYYLAHHEHVLGRWERSGYQRAYTLTRTEGASIADLAQRIRDQGGAFAFAPPHVPSSTPKNPAGEEEWLPLPAEVIEQGLPDDMRVVGSLIALPGTETLPPHIGQVTRHNPDTGETFYLSVTEAATPAGKRLAAYITVRDALRDVFREDTDEARMVLNTAYDAFHAAHGRLSRHQKLFADDPYAGRVLALEVVQKDKTVVKADIFHQSLRTRLPVEQLAGTVTDLREALIMAVSETGRLDDRGWAVVRALLTPEKAGATPEVIREQALEEGLVFRNPQTDAIEPEAQYLSGFLPDKLDAARAAAERDAHFVPNVRALEAALPEPLAPGDIVVDLGAHWVPPFVLNQFVRHLAGLADDSGWFPDDTPILTYGPESGWAPTTEWVDRKAQIARWVHEEAPELGTDRYPFVDLFLAVLRRGPIHVYDRHDDQAVLNREETQAALASADRLRERFRNFVWADPARSDHLCAIYNRLFNGFRPPVYVRPHVRFEDMSPSLLAYPTQANMVMRGLTEMSGLIAHDVGMGKTLTMIIMAHEMRRLNLARRIAIVVKKSTLVQFAAQAQEAYPQSRFLVMTNEHLSSPERRRDFVARAVTQDFDALIMTHETFAKLDVSQAVKREIVAEEMARQEQGLEMLSAAGAPRYTKKQIIARIKRLEAQIASATDSEHTDKITLDQDLGIDLLAADEAHLFKNSDAARSLDFQIKAETLRRVRRDDYGVFLATATPVSNNLNEIHRMIGYIRPDILARAGLTSLEAFRSSFVGTRRVWEPHHAGAGWVLRERDTLVNVPEIMAMLSCVMDRRTIEHDAQGVILRPEKQIRTIEVPMSPLQRMLMDDIARRAMQTKTEGEDHVFALMDAAAKTSCDVRLLAQSGMLVNVAGPGFTPLREDGSKLPHIVREVLAVYRKTQAIRGAQMVFLDMGVPGGVSADLYEDLTQALVQGGIPRNEIAAIHEATSDQARAALFDEVNAGAKRVLLGSTGKMAEGVNAQERLAAIHIVNPPWRPDIVEQAIGRGVRQGNTNAQVDILFYAAVSTPSSAGVAAVSPDAFRYQLLQTKINMFSALLSGRYTGRTFDPDTSMTMAEIAATAAGDPLVMKKFEAEAAVAQAESHTRFLLNQRSRLRSQQAMQEYDQERADILEAFVDALPELGSGEEVWFLADDAGQPIQEIGGRQDILDWTTHRRKARLDQAQPVFCRNIPMTITVHAEGSTIMVALKASVKNPDDTRTTVSRIRASTVGGALRRLSPEAIAKEREHIASLRARIAQVVAEVQTQIATLEDTEMPAATQAEAAARAALTTIEKALEDKKGQAREDGTLAVEESPEDRLRACREQIAAWRAAQRTRAPEDGLLEGDDPGPEPAANTAQTSMRRKPRPKKHGTGATLTAIG